jgi:hypothetical protein
MMRICDDFRVMRRVVITKHALSSAQVCIGIADAHRITQFGADHLIEIKKRAIPKENAGADEPIEVVRGQARERLL